MKKIREIKSDILRFFAFSLFFYLVIIPNACLCQQWVHKIDDQYYKDVLIKGLQVGDTVSDLNLGSVVNNSTGKDRLSQFKGKLVVLDFWNTICSSCIENFPKMEKLQEYFGDKIQIILVNPTESEAQIKHRLSNFVFPNLPCIVADPSGRKSELLNLFPIRSTGHQIWIDANGVIRLRGMANNNTIEKIEQLLEGSEIFVLSDNGTAPAFDPQYPYYKLLGDFSKNELKSGSFITLFNNEYNPETSGRSERVFDSVALTIRNTYVNNYLLQLFAIAFQDFLKNAQKNILYGPGPKSYIGPFGGYHLFVLPKDTLRYTGEFLLNKTDKDYIKPRVCYEQVLPSNVSAKLQRSYMLQDLNRFFGNLYDTEAKIEKINTPCYVLVRTSKSDYLKSAKQDYTSISKTIRNGKAFLNYKNASIGVVGELMSRSASLASFLTNNSRNGKAALLLNETGILEEVQIDIELPQEVQTIDDLRTVLRKYDLDILEVMRELSFVVIRDNSK